MVVYDFDVCRTRTIRGPFEINTPLVVHTNAPLTATLALELFEPISWSSEIGDFSRGIELVEFPRSGMPCDVKHNEPRDALHDRAPVMSASGNLRTGTEDDAKKL